MRTYVVTFASIYVTIGPAQCGLSRGMQGKGTNVDYSDPLLCSCSGSVTKRHTTPMGDAEYQVAYVNGI